MVSVDLESLAWLATGAFLVAAPTEYLRYRRGGGWSVRLLAWAIGAAFIVALLIFGAPFEESCSTLDAKTCVELERVQAYLLPILGGLSLMLWSVLYAAAVAVCGSIYRHALT